MLKIGDTVKIKSMVWWLNNRHYSDEDKMWRVIDNNEDSFWFCEEMVRFLGQTATITDVKFGNSNYYYDLDIDNGEFGWSEFMFEDSLTDSSEDYDEDIIDDSLSNSKQPYTLVSFGDLYIAVNLLTKRAVPRFFEDEKEFYEYCKKEGI